MLIYTQISGCVLSFIHITTSVYSPICVCAQLLKNVQLSCDPMDCSLPGSSIHGISQARILEGVATSSSRGIFPTQGSNPGCLHCRRILYRWVTWEALDRGHACMRVCAKSLQSCLILWDAKTPPGSWSMGFSRQEPGVGCHALLRPEPVSLMSPALADGFFTPIAT